MRRLRRPTGLHQGLALRRHPQQTDSQWPSCVAPATAPARWLHQRRRRRLPQYPQVSTIKEGNGPTKKSYPAFELPDVVLDLDAEDNPHVRSYDEDRDGPVQEMQWGYDPSIDGLKAHVERLRERMKSDGRAMRKRAATPFAVAQISDHEVMRVALFGGSSVKEILRPNPSRPQPLSGCGYDLRIALRRNGIPEPILGLSANTVIPFMLHRQQLAAAALKDPALRETPDETDSQAFRDSVDECQNLYQISKLCSRIDVPSSGINIDADSIDRVHARLVTLLESGEEHSSAESVLKFVNNLTIKRLSSGRDLNRSITLLGLQLASSLGVLPCILQYLQITLSMGFLNNSDQATSSARLQIGRAILTALESGEGATRGTRQQIFTLLTGGSAPKTQPSLLGLDTKDHQQNPDIFDLRLRLLGELGAVRLLWHQRKATDGDVVSTALLRGVQVLSSVPGEVLEKALKPAASDISRDAELDLQTLEAVDAHHARKGSRIPTPPSPDLAKRIAAEQIIEAFDALGISQAVALFKEVMADAEAKSRARS